MPNKPSSNPNLKVTVLLDLLGFSPLLPHKASGPEPYVPQSLAEVSYLSLSSDGWWWLGRFRPVSS